MPEQKTESRGWVRKFARRVVRVYYPRLEISGSDKIPQSGPVLLCANHSNSMVDPALIGITAVRPVRFLAKATLFDMPVMGRAMRALGMVPAYRGMDDTAQVRRNLESLDTGARILVDGKALGIFPEGKTTDEARLDKVRSGAARMAVKAYDEGARGVQVVPLGINYERKEQFRSAVWIRVGEPIDIDEWVERHEGDSRKAMRTLTTEIADNLKKLMVHLDEPGWEPWLEDLEIMVPSVVDTKEVAAGSLLQRKRIADAMNYFLKTDREQAEEVSGKIKNYREAVEMAGLKVGSPVLAHRGIPAALRVCSLLLRLVLFSLPALLGTAWHLVPFLAVRSIARILDQPGLVTKSTHRIGVGLPIYLGWYAGIGWLMSDFEFSGPVILSTLVFMPCAGVFALEFWRRSRGAIVVLWHQLLLSFRRQQLREIRELRAGLRSRLGDLAKEYAKVEPRPEPVPKILWRQKATKVTVTLSSILLVAAAVFLVVILPRDVLNREKEWLKVVSPTLPGDLVETQEGRSDLRKNVEEDEIELLKYIGRIQELEADALKATQDHNRFLQQQEADPVSAEKEDWYQRQENSDTVQDLMRRFYHFREDTLFFFLKYMNYGDVEKVPHELLLRAFLIEYVSGLLLCETSIKFVDGFKGKKNTVAKLNEGIREWGIPPGFYDFVKDGLASDENTALFQRFHPRYEELKPSFIEQKVETYEKLRQVIELAAATIKKHESNRGARFLNFAVDKTKNTGRKIKYEAQKAISSWIGDFKFKTGESAIRVASPEFDELKKSLEPGDILLERRNYYGSNAFLPGYWPHAALYVGSTEDLLKLGLGEKELRAGFEKDDPTAARFWNEPGHGFTSLDKDGHKRMIIEAVSEGVEFSSLEHSIGEADSVAVLRPQLAPGEKIEAIKRAFTFWKKPYDFEFDFTTEDKLVCTEVVYRAYGGNSASAPIQFPLVDILGRKTMPAVKLVEKFRDERNVSMPQLKLVVSSEGHRMYLDGDRKAGFQFKVLFVACCFCAFMMALLICHIGVKSLKKRLVFIILLVLFVIPAFRYFPRDDGNNGIARFRSEEDFIRTLDLEGLTWWNYYKKWMREDE